MNNALAGGQGEATVQGSGLFALGGLAGGAGLIAIAALVVGLTVTASNDSDSTVVTN